MSRRLAPSVALVSALLVAALLLAAAGPSVAVDRGWADHLRTIAHWTQERLRAAIPRDVVLAPGGRFAPAKRPGGGGGSGTVTGASWTNTNTIVYHATGRVYFELGGTAYICSGAVVQDSRSGYALVLTAAHCAYDETTRTFATNWLFIPEFDSSATYACSATTYGCWTAAALVVDNGFASAGSFNTQATLNDFAIAILGPGGKNGDQLDATVGAFPIRFSGVADGTPTYAFGYPAAGKYNGSDLVYCAGPIGSDPYNGNLTYALACDMTGGSSGGPWLTGFDPTTGTGTLTSVNSYTYRSVKNVMHGPKFNADTQAVYDAANATTANTIVGQ